MHTTRSHLKSTDSKTGVHRQAQLVARLMRGVLDIDIPCSALLTPGGVADRLYRAWCEGRFELLAMAQAGEADVLVTGDKHDLLSLRSFQRTRIITARQFLGQLGDRKKRSPRRAAPATRRGKRKPVR